MTYREKILRELETSPQGLSCSEMVKWFQMTYEEDKTSGKKQLLSTVSGVVYKMWWSDELTTHSYRKGPRGGKVYILN